MGKFLLVSISEYVYWMDHIKLIFNSLNTWLSGHVLTVAVFTGDIFIFNLLFWFHLVIYSFFLPLSQDHESELQAIYTGSEFLEGASGSNEIGVVLKSTSFYAEQGGQVLYFGNLIWVNI